MSEHFLKIEIFTGNAAFEGDERNPEIVRILRSVAADIEAGTKCGMWPLRDINGNRCGSVDFTIGETS